MIELHYAVAILIALLVTTGWVLLLSMPLLALSAVTAGGVARGVASIRRILPALTRDTVRGILCIDGLIAESALAKRLRGAIARVLALADPSTRPRACACVKESGGAFVGVLRVFNTRGHYLLRTAGGSTAAVTMGISAALDEFGDTFPARDGARRMQCPECNPKTCPLRRLKRERKAPAA